MGLCFRGFLMSILSDCVVWHGYGFDGFLVVGRMVQVGFPALDIAGHCPVVLVHGLHEHFVEYSVLGFDGDGVTGFSLHR